MNFFYSFGSYDGRTMPPYLVQNALAVVPGKSGIQAPLRRGLTQECLVKQPLYRRRCRNAGSVRRHNQSSAAFLGQAKDSSLLGPTCPGRGFPASGAADMWERRSSQVT